MRRVVVWILDVALICCALVFALLLRDNLEFSEQRFAAAIPYFFCTLLTSMVLVPTLGLSRAVWRLSGLSDYLRIVVMSCVIVACACGLAFSYNRLDGVARSLPILHAMLMIALMVGSRVARRLHDSNQKRRIPSGAVLFERQESVLIVGLNRIAELYARSVAEFAPLRVNIAGVLETKDHHYGGALQHIPVLGQPEDIDKVARDLSIHGIQLARVVVAHPFTHLSPLAKQALLQFEASTQVRVDFLDDMLGLAANTESEEAAAPEASVFNFKAEDLGDLTRRPIWRIKRAVDIVAAMILLVLLAPVMAFTALLIALDVGLPVYFWQQRPGRGGIPFEVYKFRTMRAAHTREGRQLTDAQRTSLIGKFLRWTRLDELPQLWSILIGDMSFVGPRPLLPRDQPAEYAARLVVRPGLTGWAQVTGGRQISAADKAALDIWYVQHASVWLDAKILLRTLLVIVFGERQRLKDVQAAWRDLQERGICTPAAAQRLAGRDEIGAVSHRAA